VRPTRQKSSPTTTHDATGNLHREPQHPPAVWGQAPAQDNPGSGALQALFLFGEHTRQNPPSPKRGACPFANNPRLVG